MSSGNNTIHTAVCGLYTPTYLPWCKTKILAGGLLRENVAPVGGGRVRGMRERMK